MHFIQRLFWSGMALWAAIPLLVACSDKEEKGSATAEELNLRLEVEDITATSAKIKVAHNESADKSWYGFLSRNTSLSKEALAAEAVEAYLRNEGSLHQSRQYVEVLRELDPATDYRYIAFGLKADGERYGEVSEVSFSTLEAGSNDDNNNPDAPDEINGMHRNDDWMVRYTGAGVIGDQSYDHIVAVKSFDTNPYAITIVYAEYYNPAELYGMAELLLEDMKAYLAEYNAAYGTAYTVGDMLYTGDNMDAFNLEPGRYRAVAVGYTKSGEISGLYAVSEEFEVAVPIASEAYKAWLGDWTILGANNVSCDITLESKTPNKSFYMTGWEGFSLPVVVEYDKQLDALYFYAQLVAENYDLGAEYGLADIYFFGSDRDGYYYSIEEGEYYIGIAGILDDGQRAIVQFGVNTPGYPAFKQMFFMAHFKESNDYKAFHAEEEIPTYISAMSPAASSSVKPRMVNRFGKRNGMPLPTPAVQRQKAR